MNPQELKKFEREILEKLNIKDTVVLGLSGGPDSVFLFHLLKASPCRLIVAHVNHQLRGKESDKDEQFVKNLCKNEELVIKSVDLKAIKGKRGLEEAGRKVRYDFFQKLAKRFKAKYIATAHHADDNLETIILNLSRGASLKGLCGMEEKSKLNSSTTLFRPLLSLPKAQILSYLKTKKLPYRLDKSNDNTDFTRNHIRAHIVPALKKINPNITETTAKNAKNLREIQDNIEKQAKRWLARNKVLNAKSFRKLLPALQKEILLNLHKNLIGHTQMIEKVHLEEVIKMIENNIGNKKKKLGKITISLKNNIISFST